MSLRRISSVLVAMSLVGAIFAGPRAIAQDGMTRTYYVAADEVQ